MAMVIKLTPRATRSLSCQVQDPRMDKSLTQVTQWRWASCGEAAFGLLWQGKYRTGEGICPSWDRKGWEYKAVVQAVEQEGFRNQLDIRTSKFPTLWWASYSREEIKGPVKNQIGISVTQNALGVRCFPVWTCDCSSVLTNFSTCYNIY